MSFNVTAFYIKHLSPQGNVKWCEVQVYFVLYDTHVENVFLNDKMDIFEFLSSQG